MEWQPIETAPRGGTVFIGVSADGHVGLCWRFDLDNNYGSWHEWRMVAECSDFEVFPEREVVGWMPLPDAPVTEGLRPPAGQLPQTSPARLV